MFIKIETYLRMQRIFNVGSELAKFWSLTVILYLKMDVENGLAQSRQTVGSLLIPLGWQNHLGKCSEHISSDSDQLKILTNMGMNVFKQFLEILISLQACQHFEVFLLF
jgi:hypothetical protein